MNRLQDKVAILAQSIIDSGGKAIAVGADVSTEESFHAHYNINVLGSILTVQQASYWGALEHPFRRVAG